MSSICSNRVSLKLTGLIPAGTQRQEGAIATHMEVGLKAAYHPVVAEEHRIGYPDIHHLDPTLVVGGTAIHIRALTEPHQQVAHACDFEVPDPGP